MFVVELPSICIVFVPQIAMNATMSLAKISVHLLSFMVIPLIDPCPLTLIIRIARVPAILPIRLGFGFLFLAT